MAIINFPSPIGSDADIDTMTAEQLKAYQGQLLAQLAQLDKREPKNMNSEAYDTWADAHEELEDLLDDILDRLEELDV